MERRDRVGVSNGKDLRRREWRYIGAKIVDDLWGEERGGSSCLAKFRVVEKKLQVIVGLPRRQRVFARSSEPLGGRYMSYPEIGNLDGTTVGGPHEVCRLYVAVDDALKMD